MEGGTQKLLDSARIEKLAALFLLAASVFVGFLAIDAIRDTFSPRPPMGNVISVEGTGKVTAVPDVGRISFSVTEDAESVAAAQDAATAKTNAALDALDDLAIDENDIKTTSYSVYPKYAPYEPCYNGYCPEYRQTIIGYTVSQTIEVKVRDTEKVGEVLSRLGNAEVSNLSGPNFTVDDLEDLQNEARAAAIADARAKAKALAKDLGVSLVRVTGFWENTGPYYGYDTKAYGYGGVAEAALSSPVPSLPVGEDEISITVSVSYEIR